MKIFLSWSGTLSHKLALAFKDWLPLVIQSLDPYVSSESIEKGARWSPELDAALSASRFGIICLTPDNLNSRWLNFEAGALARAIEDPKARVSPFLFSLKQSEVEGPLAGFQSTRNDKDEVRKLLSSINNAAKEEHERLKPEILERSFDTYWPELESGLGQLAKDYKPELPRATRPQSDVLEEILELVRAQQRLAASKEDVEGLDVRMDQIVQRINARTDYLTPITHMSQLIDGTALAKNSLSALYKIPFDSSSSDSRFLISTEPIGPPPIPEIKSQDEDKK